MTKISWDPEDFAPKCPPAPLLFYPCFVATFRLDLCSGYVTFVFVHVDVFMACDNDET